MFDESAIGAPNKEAQLGRTNGYGGRPKGRRERIRPSWCPVIVQKDSELGK